MFKSTERVPNRNPIVTCDKCGKKFKLKPSRIRNEKVGDGEVERSYFNCPCCKHKFIIFYQDQEFKDNIEKMDKLRKEMSKLDVNSEDAQKILKDYTNLHQRNLDISKGYKGVYGS